MMKDFIKRNSPVFVVGVITFFIFMGIIIQSQKNDTKETDLVGVEDYVVSFNDEVDRVIPEEDLSDFLQQVEESLETSEATWYPGKNTSMHGDVLFIEYREEKGFVPRNAVGISGKIVMWHNKTQNPIQIKQLTNKFDEFEPPVTIAPQKLFAIRMDIPGIWTYQEVETGEFGSVFIEKAK
jgi:hypothetical protein